MAQHNILGKIGEDYAANYLLQKGYRILHRNWKLGDFEVDIAAMDGDTLVFVEVKTRSNDLQDPVDAVDELRMNRLTRAMNAYIKYFRLDCPCRFDIIGIIMNGHETGINHIEEAFRPRPRYIGPNSWRPVNRWSTQHRRRKL